MNVDFSPLSYYEAHLISVHLNFVYFQSLSHTQSASRLGKSLPFIWKAWELSEFYEQLWNSRSFEWERQPDSFLSALVFSNKNPNKAKKKENTRPSLQ